MGKQSIVFVTIGAFLIAACGRIDDPARAHRMTQEQAMDVLQNQVASSENASSNPGAVTAQDVASVLQDLAKSGQLKLPSSAKGAISSNGTLDTATLTNILNMIAQGKSAFSVAGSVVANSGSTTQAKFNLDTLVAILQAAIPIVATFAPQIAGVMQAVLVIVPMIKMFIGLFKKPSPSPAPSAWVPAFRTARLA